MCIFRCIKLILIAAQINLHGVKSNHLSLIAYTHFAFLASISNVIAVHTCRKRECKCIDDEECVEESMLD